MKKIFPLSILLLLLAGFSHRPMNWVAIGDSITYLNDHPDETKRPHQQGVSDRCNRKAPLSPLYQPGPQRLDRPAIRRKIDSLNIPVGDIYTVFLGTNDWWHGVPIGTWDDYRNGTGDSTIYGSFRVLVDKLRSLSPAAPYCADHADATRRFRVYQRS